MSESAAARHRVAEQVRLARLAEQPRRLLAHAPDEPAGRGGRLCPYMPAGAPADVDGEVGGALDLGDDPHRRHHLAQVRRHGRLEGEHRVAPLLEGDAQRRRSRRRRRSSAVRRGPGTADLGRPRVFPVRSPRSGRSSDVVAFLVDDRPPPSGLTGWRRRRRHDGVDRPPASASMGSRRARPCPRRSGDRDTGGGDVEGFEDRRVHRAVAAHRRRAWRGPDLGPHRGRSTTGRRARRLAVSTRRATLDGATVPPWVVLSAHVAIGLGT